MNAVVATSFLFIFLSTAEFIYAKSSTALSPHLRRHARRLAGHAAHRRRQRRQAPPLRRPHRRRQGRQRRGPLPPLQEARRQHRLRSRRLPDLRPRRLLHRRPGHHLQDVRLAPQRRLHGPEGRLQPHPAQVHHRGGQLTIQAATSAPSPRSSNANHAVALFPSTSSS